MIELFIFILKTILLAISSINKFIIAIIRWNIAINNNNINKKVKNLLKAKILKIWLNLK